MFNQGDEYESPLGERTLEDLMAYRIKLFHLVIKIYEPISANDYWLFEREKYCLDLQYKKKLIYCL